MRALRGRDDRGAASIWLVAFAMVFMAMALVATLRSLAVLARHRAESAADLAALAAAGRIGVAADVCAAAERTAAANRARVVGCAPSLAPDGRSGSVTVRVRLHVVLPVIGGRDVTASARAGRGRAPP